VKLVSAWIDMYGFGLPVGIAPVVFHRGGIIEYYAEHTVVMEILCFAVKIF